MAMVLASPEFEHDPYPGAPRILFIGYAESTHTHAWIDLLRNERFNVRMFGITSTPPPANWPVRTYINTEVRPEPCPAHWAYWPLQSIGRRSYRTFFRRSAAPSPQELNDRRLGHVLREWRPQIVHALGLRDCGEFYHQVRRRVSDLPPHRRVVQVRGGPDWELNRLLPELHDRLLPILVDCDEIIADTPQNYEHFNAIPELKGKGASIGPVPGTGGVDVDELTGAGPLPPSQRKRSVVWPKAYDWNQSKGTPVLEAIRIAWPKIAPCEFHLLMVVQEEMRIWIETMPPEIRPHLHVNAKVTRDRALELMASSRVMLAPSLSDGVPNCLYEAMAAGSFPIVSPLPTITPIVRDPDNALLVRNLYPQEIADGLVRALNDDALVDSAAIINRGLVRQRADRRVIGPKVANYYRGLCS